MTTSTIELQIAGPVATVWLNRADTRNAFNPQLIAEITEAFTSLRSNDQVRAIVLAGRGSAFSAGGDLNWMKAAASYGQEQNEEGGRALAGMLDSIASCPKPVIARVHGAAFAGGMGLVAACDIVVADSNAKFALTEVKLGLTASTISPYVIQAMGAQQARRYFLTAEVISADKALQIGIVHELVSPDALDAKVTEMLGHLLAAGPNALAESKRLLREVTHHAIDAEIREFTAKHIAFVRSSPETQEGISAFFAKRKPNWIAS